MEVTFVKMLSIEEIKSLQLQILLQFHEYCTEHALNYFITYGTLIGAVRHQGFIPWDDDIDVMMPRPDYEKFLELSQKVPVSKYLCSKHYSFSKHYNAPFVKLTDIRTNGHEMHLNKNIMCGVWIDIFPIDGVPENKNERKSYIKKMRKMRQVLELSSRPLIFCKNPLRLLKRIIIYSCFHLFRYQKLAEKLDKLSSTKYRFEDCQTVGVICFCGKADGFFPKSMFLEAQKINFEGHLFNAPQNIDLYLTKIYGDYKTLPPPEKRTNRHQYKAWWLEQPISSNSEVL